MTSSRHATSEPFGRPYASQMSLEEVAEGFCDMPNMQFSIRSGSFAFTSRRGGGKTHLLRKMFLELKNRSGDECEYEPMSLTTEDLLQDLRQYSRTDLSQHLYDPDHPVLTDLTFIPQ